jgi:hypothetical protein
MRDHRPTVACSRAPVQCPLATGTAGYSAHGIATVEPRGGARDHSHQLAPA